MRIGQSADWLFALVLALSSISPAFAFVQTEGGDCSSDSIAVRIFFRTNHSDIDPTFRNNSRHISRFFTSLDSVTRVPQVSIDSVVLVSSSASPEGNVRANNLLSRRRAAAVEALFKQHCTTDVRFRVVTAGEDWEGLSALLRTSGIKGREEALKIMDSTPEWVVSNGRIVGSRKKSMMDLKGGNVWREMHQQLFPLLRQATLTVYYATHQEAETPAGIQKEELKAPDTLASAPPPALPVEEPVAAPTEPSPVIPTETRPPLCAIKTNLLADAATLVNIGIEIPVGQRVSIAGMFYFPWWRNRANDLTIQMLGSTVEGRYWLGDRSRQDLLTGFFAGVYGGAGYYDFQLGSMSNGDGVQGDFYVMGGISAGYAHSIGRHLRLEYSVGVGYLRTDYRKYKPVEGTKYGDIKVMEYPWEKKRLSGFLPSKLEVSLVWLLHAGKGGRP